MEHMGEERGPELITQLEKAQKRRKVSDAQFARDVLHVHYSTWSRIRHRNREPGVEFLGHVLGYLPEMLLVVIDYLRDKGKS